MAWRLSCVKSVLEPSLFVISSTILISLHILPGGNKGLVTTDSGVVVGTTMQLADPVSLVKDAFPSCWSKAAGSVQLCQLSLELPWLMTHLSLKSHTPLPRSVKIQWLMHAGIWRPGWPLPPILKSYLIFKALYRVSWGLHWDWTTVPLLPLPNPPSFSSFLYISQVVIPRGRPNKRPAC